MEWPEEFSNCAFCSYEDLPFFKSMGSKVPVETTIGPRILDVFPDRNCPRGQIHIVFQGEYEGCWEIQYDHGLH